MSQEQTHNQRTPLMKKIQGLQAPHEATSKHAATNKSLGVEVLAQKTRLPSFIERKVGYLLMDEGVTTWVRRETLVLFPSKFLVSGALYELKSFLFGSNRRQRGMKRIDLIVLSHLVLILLLLGLGLLDILVVIFPNDPWKRKYQSQ